jgi:ADP-ribosylglycohydrolase
MEIADPIQVLSSRLSVGHSCACLLGGAVGDALGAPVEFLTLEQIRNSHGPSGVTGYCEFPDQTGEFTDDTQMTLFTAEGLLRAWHRSSIRGMDGPPNLLTFHSYLRWLQTQGNSLNLHPVSRWQINLDSGWLIRQKDLFKKRAPGNACINSLRSGQAGTIRNPVNHSKGCGGIMRMAPVGLVFNDPEIAFDVGCELAAITHGHPTGYLSAGAFAAIIQQLDAGRNLEEAIQTSLDLLCKRSGHLETLDAIQYAIKWYQQTRLTVETGAISVSDQIARLGQGWVGEEALAIALFCSLHHRNDFRKGVLASVNHGGDSDSTGSITGNILGLMNGIGAIPPEWIENLRSAQIVRQVGEDIHTGCKSDSFEMDRGWWEKYPGY